MDYKKVELKYENGKLSNVWKYNLASYSQVLFLLVCTKLVLHCILSYLICTSNHMLKREIWD